MKKTLAMLAVPLALMGCKEQKKAVTDSEEQKAVVIYYSQTGATQKVAEEIAGKLGIEALRIDVEQPYDGTYDETIERCKSEMESDELSKVTGLPENLADYDVVFLGYPIWFGTYAPPIASLLAEADLGGKTIVPFCTFGSGGLESSVRDLKANLPESEVVDGYGVRNARLDKMPAEVERFLKESGFVEGEVETLPEYGEQQELTQEDADVFQAACGGYPMPLGTPVSVAKRVTPDGTDCKFMVNSKNMEGEDVEATIYITVSSEEGATPEFTRVVR